MTGLLHEVVQGLTATVRLSRLRAQVRTPRARLRARVAGVVALCLLVVAAMSGDIVAWSATHAWLASPIAGYLARDSSVGLPAALGAVLAGVVFAPITGAAAQAQFPDGDLAGIRPSRLYRYFDGLWNSLVSPVGVSPLLLLVAAASIATHDGRGRFAAVVVVVMTWLAAMLAMALFAWTIELTRRRWVARLRWYLAVVVALVVALGVLVDPAHGRTVFGVSPALQRLVRGGATGSTPEVALGVGVLALVGLALLVGGILVCRRTLVLPAAVERVRQRTGSVTVPVNPSWAMFTMLVTTLVRTREVRRPIIMMIAVAMPMLFAWIHYSRGDATSMLASVTMVVPLAMSLGWGVNVFGVLGGAVTLLLAQPRAWRLLIRHVVLVQLIASLGLGLLLMVVAVATSTLSWSVLPAYLAGLAVSSVIATGLSLRYSVEKPHRTRLTGRGDPLVPPIVGMGYVIRIMLTGATTGLAVAVIAGLVPWIAGVVCVLVALSAYRSWRRLSRRWADPAHRSWVAALVGAV
ncbi:MAG TPA: hypothetical protein VFK68_11635 [Propionibacteriaceae bacterium]|nr:hypothetical protein [Propionibacteriaceae bacterium]